MFRSPMMSAWVLTVAASLATLNLAGCPGTMTPADGLLGGNPNPAPAPAPAPAPTPTPQPAPAPTPAKTPWLVILNHNTGTLTTYRNPATVNGNIAPSTLVGGNQTMIESPRGVAADARAGVLVSSNVMNNSRVTAYNDIFTASGNFSPDRNLTGPATLLSDVNTGPAGIDVDPVNDLLLVGSNVGAFARVLIFGGASTSAANGNVAPLRSFNVPNGTLQDITGLDLAPSGDLYIANRGRYNVSIFASAVNLNGGVTPTRVLTSPNFVTPGPGPLPPPSRLQDVFVDHADNLYVVDSTYNRVLIFRNASTVNGAQQADVVLVVPVAQALWSVTVDRNGVGYVADLNANAIWVYDNIANRNGTLVPDRAISGANTQIAGPWDLMIVER